MNSSDKALWEELNTLVWEAGQDGGQISPSVYETAQCLRIHPPAEPEPVVVWLLSHQGEDGGWCRNDASHLRDVPTLAAMLALYDYPDYPGVPEAIRLGRTFLLCQAAQWDRPFQGSWPVCVEMVLPYLLDQALASGIDLPNTLYTTLRERRHLWLKKLNRYPMTAGSPILHCFETWGTIPDPNWLDSDGSIGNSPAATAHWLSLAQGCPELETACCRAEEYLRRASCAIDGALSGIYPTLWPLQNFERSFLLHTLQIAGLLRHPRLKEAVTIQAEALLAAMRPEGIGYSSAFMCDGDDTAAAACTLVELGYSFDPKILHRYASGDHFVAYQGELDPSLSVTARVAQALQMLGESLPRTRRFFREQQSSDGGWVIEKWHLSWLYVTLVVLVYMASEGETKSVRAAGRAICRDQSLSGAWELNGVASRTDTAFAVLALTVLWRQGLATRRMVEARERGLRWLRQQQCGGLPITRRDWIAKTAYAFPRVDRCFEICAMLSYS